MLIQRTETTHHLNLGWLTEGDEQALCSVGLWLRRFSPSETCLSTGVAAGKHQAAGGIVSTPVRLGESVG